ncbi:methyl-coenzyme M reductase [Acinetobacter sp. 18QD2AZ41W]|uniref:methyl-coenzyme M reductase n=1 Tax=Acinetobacter sp. 18QD2AZ41W TaxID=2692137 RepID=UPI00135A7D34|nr:methyl-coenzyme M reductase [Acinetobacter sp. 18QD2AZ41W]
MALIPKSQGRDVSRPVMQQHTPMTGLGSIGKTIDGIIDERRRKSDEADVSAKRAELYHNDLAEKEAKVKLDDVLTTELSEQVTLLKNDVANGAMNADVANKTLQQWSEKRFKDMEGELPGHAHQALSQHWSSNVSRNATAFLPLQLSADSKKDTVLADRVTEIGTRMDRKAGREYLESNLATLNLSEAEKQARIYGYESTRDVLDIEGRITAAIESKNTADLQALITDMDSGKYGYIDGPQVQQKKAQAQSRIESIEKYHEVKNKEREQLSGKLMSELEAQVMTGRALDSDYLNEMENSFKGTTQEDKFNFYKSQSNRFQRFANLSTPEQLKGINEQKALMANSKTSNAVLEGKILSVYESIYNKKKATLTENPNQAVREAGLEAHSLNAVELKSNPQSFAVKVFENGVRQFALDDDNLKVKPISMEDLPAAKQAFYDMGVNQKLDFIGSLISESKGVPKGNQIWAATIKQLGGDDNSYLMAGVARANNYRSENGEDVAASIISGTQALKNKQMIMPGDDLLRSEFAKYVGNTVSGGTANMTFDAFKSIYAHLTERNNYQHKDNKDIDTSLANTALSMATGGVYEQDLKYGSKSGGTQVKWKVSKPYGMKDERFEAILDTRFAAIAQKYKMSESEVRDLRLRREAARGPNGVIRYSLIDERGKPMFYLNMPDGVTK